MRLRKGDGERVNRSRLQNTVPPEWGSVIDLNIVFRDTVVRDTVIS
jgi:hypothetical protein